jgi:hypothetical protein
VAYELNLYLELCRDGTGTFNHASGRGFALRGVGQCCYGSGAIINWLMTTGSMFRILCVVARLDVCVELWRNESEKIRPRMGFRGPRGWKLHSVVSSLVRLPEIPLRHVFLSLST